MRGKTWVSVAAVVAAATVVAVVLRPYVDPVNLAMVYLLAVVGIAARAEPGKRIGGCAGKRGGVQLFLCPSLLHVRRHELRVSDHVCRDVGGYDAD